MKKKIVILTGAGIDAESGIPTFRTGDNALWEGYRFEDVATPEAWDRNPELVQKFYNERRKSVLLAQPNDAHLALVELEKKYDVTVVTTNISDLHERAGSSNILHLHGLITRSQSGADPEVTYPIDGDEIKMGDLCEYGTQLRPHVVWFGEQVPALEKALSIVLDADIFIVCGTSLQVYPAAGLIYYVNQNADKYVVDVTLPPIPPDFVGIEMKASEGITQLVNNLMAE